MSRTRSSTTTYDCEPTELHTDNDISSGSPTDYTYDYSYMHPQFTKSMTDEVTPGYFSKARQGEYLPINPMTQSGVQEFSWTSGVTTWNSDVGNPGLSQVLCDHSLPLQSYWDMTSSRYNWVPYSFQGSFSPSLPSQNTIVTEAIARARSNSFDAGTFMAELNKTIDMIDSFQTNVFRRANRIVSARRSDIAARGIAAFSETWLEGRYGWRTLAYDLNDIREAIDKINNSEWSNLGRAYASYSDVGEYSYSNNYAVVHYRPRSQITSNNRSTMQYVFTQTAEREARAGAIVELVLENIAFVDPLVTAWEVVPFSFIIDWFTNMGDAIKASSPFASGDLQGVWYSERDTVVSQMETTAVPYWLNSNSTVTGTTSGTSTIRYKTYQRSEVSPPLFDLSFRLNLDWQKLVDLAAIIALRYLGLLREISRITRV